MPKLARPTYPLADVNVLPQSDGSLEIVASFMPDPQIIVGEGDARAFIALDASVSMKEMYGHGISPMFPGGPNFVEMVGRKLGSILCAVTKSGRASGIYWAATSDGSGQIKIGEFDEQGWQSASIPGPTRNQFGRRTMLKPVIQHAFEDVGKGADWTMGVIITDGIIDDEKEAMEYCLQVGREIAEGHRKPVKLVLIGVGTEVDEGQLERFDDMFEGTDLKDKVDIWSHGMAASFQDEEDIFAALYGELMNEETIIAPSGRVEDTNGNLIASWNDGLPGQLRFKVAAGTTAFVVKTPHIEIVQSLSEVLQRV